MNSNRFLNYFKELYFFHPKSFQLCGLIFLSLFSLCLFNLSLSLWNPKEKLLNNEITAHTFIPKNHVLIPIKLANKDSISAIMEEFSYVDLYIAQKIDEIFKKGRKIMQNVLLLRAPLDPQQFGIIVPELFSDQILKVGLIYFAILHSHDSSQGLSKAQWVGSPKSPAQRIIYGEPTFNNKNKQR